MLILATIGPFIFNYLRKKAELSIRKEEMLCQETIGRLSKDVTYMRAINELLDKVTLTLVQDVRLKFAAFWMREDFYKGYQIKSWFPSEAKAVCDELLGDEHPLVKRLSDERKVLGKNSLKEFSLKFDAEIIIPCVMNNGLIGFVALGSKINNMEYSANELIMYDTLGSTLSLAVENCIFWKEIADNQRKARLAEMDIFAYSMRHEVGNPNQVVLGQAEAIEFLFMERLSSEEDRKELKEMLGLIKQSSLRIFAMLKAIKNFGAPATGVGELISIEEVVEDTCCLYEPRFKNNKIYFEKTLQENKEKFCVLGELPVFMNVLGNLFDNAIHAVLGVRDERVKKISLKTEYINNEFARITVSDNGYGIKPEFAAVMFAPFTTTKASTEGTGMGLYNVRNMIQPFNGRVWGESAGHDQGAVFYLEFPISREKPKAEPEKKSKCERKF